MTDIDWTPAFSLLPNLDDPPPKKEREEAAEEPVETFDALRFWPGSSILSATQGFSFMPVATGYYDDRRLYSRGGGTHLA